MNTLLLYGFTQNECSEAIIGIDGSPIQWLKVDSVYVAMSEVKSIEAIVSNLATPTELDTHPAVIYQNITRAIHRSVDSLPVRFPTAVSSVDQLSKLMSLSEGRIRELICEYGSKSEHSFYVQLKDRTKRIPAELKDESKEGIIYLKKKFDLYQEEQWMASQLQTIEDHIHLAFGSDFTDYLLKRGDHAVSLHLLSTSKEGFLKGKIRTLQAALSTCCTLKELGIYPPFHFLNFDIQSLLNLETRPK